VFNVSSSTNSSRQHWTLQQDEAPYTQHTEVSTFYNKLVLLNQACGIQTYINLIDCALWEALQQHVCYHWRSVKSVRSESLIIIIRKFITRTFTQSSI